MPRIFLMSACREQKAAIEFRLFALVLIAVGISVVGPLAGSLGALYRAIETSISNLGVG